MRKKEAYSPIDTHSNVIKVTSDEQFSAFLSWLSGSSVAAKEQRKAVYEKIGGTDNFETKNDLIQLVCGDYLKALLEQTSELARYIEPHVLEPEIATSNIPMEELEEHERVQKELLDAVQSKKALIERYFHTVRGELFERSLTAVGLSKAGVVKLRSVFEKGCDFVKEMISAVQMVSEPRKSAPASNIVQRFEDYRSSARARAQVYSDTPMVLSSSQDRQRYGELAAMIHYLNTVGSAERAEILLRFEMYVKSGHAHLDMETKKLRRGMSEEEKASVVRFRELLNTFKSDPTKVHTETLIKALNERCAHLFYTATVHGAKEKVVGERSNEDFFLESVKGATGITDLGKKGEVDGVCLSADGKTLLIGFASSLTSLKTQENQWQRHLSAIKNTLQRKTYSPWSSVEDVKCFVTYPALISDKPLRGATAGENILGQFDQNCVNSMQKHVQETLNILPFLNTLIADASLLGFSQMDVFRCNLVGSNGALWNDQMDLCAKMPVQEKTDHVARSVAQCYKQAFEVLQTMEFKPFAVEGIANEGGNVVHGFIRLLLNTPNKLSEFLEKSNIDALQEQTLQEYVQLSKSIKGFLEKTQTEEELRRGRPSVARNKVLFAVSQIESQALEALEKKQELGGSVKSVRGMSRLVQEQIQKTQDPAGSVKKRNGKKP